MKTVYLLRHAKAEKDFTTPDLQRSLTDRGKEDIAIVGARLRQLEVNPSLIISSPAKRAKKTAELMSIAIDYTGKPELEAKLYEANPLEILYVIQALPDKVSSVMLVGHNPGFTSAVSFFCDTELDHLPTCGVARIDFHKKNWKSVEEGRGKLAFLEYPRKLKDQSRKG